MISPVQKISGWPRRHPRLAAFVLVLVVLGTATGGVFLWAGYHLRAAQRAIERREFEQAQHHLDLCLKVRFRSAAVHLLAAQAARRRDAYDTAQQHLAACAQLEGSAKTTALERMLLSAQQGDLTGVEPLLMARTGEDDPDAVMVLEAMAKGYLNRYWQSRAQVSLNILLQREPEHFQALLMRARVSVNLARNGAMEHEEAALRDYEKAVQLNPSFDARIGLAGTLYRVGRPWDAMLQYEELRLIHTDNPEVLLGLARCRYSLREVDASRQLLDELLLQQPGHAAALLERGRLEYHAGNLAEAEKWLRQAAVVAPLYESEPHHFLWQCLQAEHKDEEARQCQDRLREREADLLAVTQLTVQTNRYPQNVALRYETAMNLLRVGREQDGLAGLYFVLDHEPRHAPAHAALADYFERNGQPSRAVRHRRASFPSAGPNSSPR